MRTMIGVLVLVGLLAAVSSPGCGTVPVEPANHAVQKPAAKNEATQQNTTGGAVGVSVNTNRQTGTAAVSGSHSPTFTSVNSAWPVVVLVLGLALLAMSFLWHRERRHRRRTLILGRLAREGTPYRDATNCKC